MNRIEQIKELEGKLQEKGRDAVLIAAEIGKLLIQQREESKRDFLVWCDENLSYSQAWAYRLIKIAEYCDKVLLDYNFQRNPTLEIAYKVAVQEKRAEKKADVPESLKHLETDKPGLLHKFTPTKQRQVWREMNKQAQDHFKTIEEVERTTEKLYKTVLNCPLTISGYPAEIQEEVDRMVASIQTRMRDAEDKLKEKIEMNLSLSDLEKRKV